MVQRRSYGKHVDNAKAYVVDGLRTRLGNWRRLRRISGRSGHESQSALVYGYLLFDGSFGFRVAFYMSV